VNIHSNGPEAGNGSVQTVDAPTRNEEPPIVASRRFIWLYAILFLICLGGAFDWFTARTQRLYLKEHSDATKQAGAVSQHFGIRDHRVIPEIDSRDEGRFVFPIKLHAPHKLVFKMKPKGGVASYQIYLRRGEERRLLASETLRKSRTRRITIPAATGELEVIGHGSLGWLDLRLVRRFFLWPVYLLAFLALGAMSARLVAARKRLFAEWLTLLVTLLLSLAIIESALRFFALRLPPAIIAARNEFGLAGADTRLIDPVRYRLRLRPNVDVFSEWRFGGLVPLVIPKELSPGTLHRYHYRTDAEGFRNATVRQKIDIAALGDSFTDAANLPVAAAWPSRLEELTGRIVQNYGTSGFGPQQELYALRDYALKHQPRWTVLAYFMGNDLADAEVFDRWERSVDRMSEAQQAGWRLRDSFQRYETLYLWTIGVFAADRIYRSMQPGETTDAGPPSQATSPTFDRGLFTVPVANRTVRYAFLPHYLQGLETPRAEIERSHGWELTEAALRQMKSDCDQQGSTFMLMLIPSKGQVYWPMTERSLTPALLQEAVAFYSHHNRRPLRVDDVRANRLAQNAMLQDFCEREKIPMLDLTPPLQREVEAGYEMYFPDDPHWNRAGHDLAARELAGFLAKQK